MSRYRSAIVSACIVLAFALSIRRPALAQYSSSLNFHGGLGVATTSYNRKAAERSGTVARSFGFEGVLEPRLYETIGVPIMLGWEYLGPICFDVDQSVDCSRRTERRTSLFFASIGAALYGPSVPLGTDDRASRPRPFLIAGHEWVSEAIGDDGCVTCTIESVRFDGGRFIEPGIEFSATRDMFVGIGYRVYDGSSDLENRFVLRLSSISR